VFFADVRGSTAIAEKVGPVEFAALLNRFYKVAMDALIPNGQRWKLLLGFSKLGQWLGKRAVATCGNRD